MGSTAPQRFLPTVPDIPIVGPKANVRLIKLMSGSEYRRDVVTVARAPGYQLVDDHVFDRQNPFDRAVKCYLLILDYGNNQIRSHSFSSNQEQMGRLAGIGHLANLEALRAESVTQAVDGLDEQIEISGEPGVLPVTKGGEGTHQRPADSFCVKNAGDGRQPCQGRGLVDRTPPPGGRPTRPPAVGYRLCAGPRWPMQ